MKKIIRQAPASQKEFYALDIGAGNFQWSQGLADYLEKQTDLPKDIQVHIVGIRGEKYLGERVVKTDRCKIYNLGAFKIEELCKKFQEEGLDLERKIDLAVSRWCFRHLVDPVGTFVQTYDLLRPKTSFLLMDGFFFLHEKDSMTDSCHDSRMTRLFLDTKAPFLTKYFDDRRSFNHFLLQRPDATPCQIPMSYVGQVSADERWQIGSKCVTQFKRESQELDKEEICVPCEHWEDHYSDCVPCGHSDSVPHGRSDMCGDKRMYGELKKNGLLEKPYSIWSPLQDKERRQAFSPIHQAILNGDHPDKIEEYLNCGNDIDESDEKGCTPLHVAIQTGSLEIFNLLMKRGARPGLMNGDGLTPLHLAAQLDTKGQYLPALIAAGAELNSKAYAKDCFGVIQDRFGRVTALRRAISTKNFTAIKILIEAGATISEQDHKNLNNLAFSMGTTIGSL